MQYRRESRYLACFVAVCLVFYITVLCLLNSIGIYNINKNSNNDRFFSLDDVYYSVNIYSIHMESSLRVVKHPLFMVFGNIFTYCEKALLGNIGINSHYLLIIVLQIMVQILALIYLFKILREFYRLDMKYVFLLLAIYAFSVSAFIFTFFAESYIFSGAALIMSYYFILKKNVPVSILLGVIVTGITITNFVIWAIMVMLLVGGVKRKVTMLAASAAILTVLVSVFPVGRIFFKNFFHVFGSSPRNYSDNFDLYGMAIRTIYSIFGTTVFYVDTVNQSPFGEYIGKAVSFVPSSNIPIFLMILLWIGLLAYSAIKNFRSRLLLAPLAILVFNLLLHGIRQYGLKEAFLYSLHHFFAQILMVAAVFSPAGHNAANRLAERLPVEEVLQETRARRVIFALLLVFFAGEIVLNLKGYIEFYHYIFTLV